MHGTIWKIILLCLYNMGSSVHPLYISNSYCERVVEQVKLDFPEVSWHQPGRNSTLNAADKWSLYLGTSQASTTTSQLLSFPTTVDLLLSSAARPSHWHPLSPSLVYYSSVVLVKPIASQPVQTLTFVASLCMKKLNNWSLCVCFVFS